MNLRRDWCSAALAHSEDMADNNYFGHTGSDGSTLGDRANAAGFTTFPIGENVAAGYDDVRSLVLAWMWCARAPSCLPVQTLSISRSEYQLCCTGSH